MTDYSDIDVDITYMIMGCKDDIALPAPKDGYIIEKQKIDAITYWQYYRAVGEEWFWWERLAWGEDALNQLLKRDDIVIYVLSDAQGNFIGYGECDYRKSISHQEANLAYFGIISDYIGQGLGGYFLKSMIYHLFHSAPNNQKIHNITVNSCTLDHENAIPNYLKYGFDITHHEFITITDPRSKGYIPAHIANPNRY